MNHHPTSQTLRPAFTLVELLIVITIIAVLASLAAVSAGKIRDRAKSANAVNSLRQICIAQVSYSADNHGAINTIGDIADGDLAIENSFWGRMQPHLFGNIGLSGDASDVNKLKNAINGLFQTDNAETMIGTPFKGIPLFTEAGLPVPLGFNEAMRPTAGQSVRGAVFSNPARTIYIAYGREFFNASHGASYTPMPQSGGASGPGIYYLENRTAIVGFLDGHVETRTPPMPAQMFE